MPTQLDVSRARFPEDLAAAVKGKRVMVLGGGSAGGLGRAVALAVGLNGAESVCVHFHRSYSGGLDVVEAIKEHGGNAFPCQANLTNSSDLWSMRSYVLRMMGGRPPNLILCNSDKAERGYRFGRAPEKVEGESSALRRARVRQAFIDDLAQSNSVLDMKTNGFLGLTHLWASEAREYGERVQFVYFSSRQAIDPGRGVPGYALANWAILQLPQILSANLGNDAAMAAAVSAVLPFVKTPMTAPYQDKPRFWNRWQPRMLEPHEVTAGLFRLLTRPVRELNGQVYQLNVEEDEDERLLTTWSEIRLKPLQLNLPWSAHSPDYLD